MIQRLGVIWVLGMMLLGLSFTVLVALASQNQGLARVSEVREVFRELNFAALPASSQTAGSQSSLEGICSCLQDTPGGYCYEAETNVTQAAPFIPTDYWQLEVK